MSCITLPFQWVTLIFSTFNLQNNVKNHQKNWKTIKSFDRINIIELSKLSISIQNFVWCTEPFFPVCIDLTVITGSRCERPISECCNYGSSAPNSCLNGGTCDDSTPGSPQCICDSCFTDEFCTTCECRYIFSQGYFPYFFLIFAHLWLFGGWGFGVWVLVRVFWIGVFSWRGLGTVVWGLLGFLWLGFSI